MTMYAPLNTPPPPAQAQSAKPQPPPLVLVGRGSRGAAVAAWAVLAVSAAAVVFSGIVLVRPETPGVHTVVVPPAPPTFTAAEIANAKQEACAAWVSASTTMAAAGKAVADAPGGWNNPETQDAIAFEARTTLVQSAYLRSKVGPATPPEIAQPIHDYLVASFEQEDATMRRVGSERNAAIDRSNVAVDKVNAACGLK
ncbi:hypothetical protein PJI20_10295 [Mycobacterium kansasii]